MHHPSFILQVDYSAKTATLKGTVLREGDWLSLNGSTGEVLSGKQPVKAPELSGGLGLLEWLPSCGVSGRVLRGKQPGGST